MRDSCFLSLTHILSGCCCKTDSWKNYVCPQFTSELLISKLAQSEERVKAHVDIIQVGITSRKLYTKQNLCSKINKKFQVERHFEEFCIGNPETGS